MTSNNPTNDEQDKPVEKPRQSDSSVAPATNQAQNDISLGGLVPPGKDALHQVNQNQAQSSDLLTFQPRIDLGMQRSDQSTLNMRSSIDFKREPGGLSLPNAQQQAAFAPKEFRSNWTPGNADANVGLSFQGGSRQFFRIVKSDYEPRVELRPQAELQSLTNKFLTETEPREDRHLSAAERQELAHSRQKLADAQGSADVLSNALHLARVYQHLRYIEEAKKALELALGIDPESMQARQLFKELERMHPVDIGVASAAIIDAELTKSSLRRCILNLSGGRVIVAGDLLIDELLEGKPERISREAPVLILEHVDTVHIPGGAANTAHNITAMGGHCHAIGICGEDEYAEKLATMLEAHGITHSLVRDASRPTTVKTRILSKSHSLMQQLLRLDRISHEPISKEVESALVHNLEQAGPSYRAIVLSDYKAGVITDGIIQACRRISSLHQTLLIVDAQQSFDRFKGVTLMTPNQPDTEKAVGYQLDTREALERAGQQILAATGAKALLVTRGGDGMALFQQNHDMVELPAFNRSDVFDVTGAGDTVVGTMALALVTGASFVEAMALGNLAAGIVVKKPGTAVTSQKEMIDTLEQLNLPQ